MTERRGTVRRIDQEMATAAADALPRNVSKDLRTRYRQLRSMLNTAGLAASYAFIASKAGDPDGGDSLKAAYGRVALALIERLAGLDLLTGEASSLSVRDVMRQLGEMDPVRYARASAEAAALVGWLARLADAVVAEEGGNGGV